MCSTTTAMIESWLDCQNKGIWPECHHPFAICDHMCLTSHHVLRTRSHGHELRVLQAPFFYQTQMLLVFPEIYYAWWGLYKSEWTTCMRWQKGWRLQNICNSPSFACEMGFLLGLYRIAFVIQESLTHPPPHSLNRSLSHSLCYSFTRLLTCLLTYLITYLLL